MVSINMLTTNIDSSTIIVCSVEVRLAGRSLVRGYITIEHRIGYTLLCSV